MEIEWGICDTKNLDPRQKSEKSKPGDYFSLNCEKYFFNFFMQEEDIVV
jgi:hypothetical protein